jgi:hypothetical protein
MEDATAANRQCSKCTGEMEAGFVLDLAHSGVYPAIWAGGPLEKNWLGGVKIRNKRFYRVETWRCKDCGNLESCARSQAGLFDS